MFRERDGANRSVKRLTNQRQQQEIGSTTVVSIWLKACAIRLEGLLDLFIVFFFELEELMGNCYIE